MSVGWTSIRSSTMSVLPFAALRRVASSTPDATTFISASAVSSSPPPSSPSAVGFWLPSSEASTSGYRQMRWIGLMSRSLSISLDESSENGVEAELDADGEGSGSRPAYDTDGDDSSRSRFCLLLDLARSEHLRSYEIHSGVDSTWRMTERASSWPAQYSSYDAKSVASSANTIATRFVAATILSSAPTPPPVAVRPSSRMMSTRDLEKRL